MLRGVDHFQVEASGKEYLVLVVDDLACGGGGDGGDGGGEGGGVLV